MTPRCRVAIPVWFLLVLVVLAGALAPSLRAQDTDSVKVTTDLGYVNSGGNTDMTSLNAGEELVARFGAWGIKQTFGAIYGRTNDTVSTSLWRSSLRGERGIGGRVGVYLVGAFDRNTFAGISRRFEEGAGLVVRPVETPTDRLELEGGGGFTQQRSTTGETRSFPSARGAATYKRSLGASSTAQLTTEVLPNLEETSDTRVNSRAELVAPLSQRLALKLSYVWRFDNQPEPTFEKSDRIFTAGLQITL